jgi:hypothetical protein
MMFTALYLARKQRYGGWTTHRGIPPADGLGLLLLHGRLLEGQGLDGGRHLARGLVRVTGACQGAVLPWSHSRAVVEDGRHRLLAWLGGWAVP